MGDEFFEVSCRVPRGDLVSNTTRRAFRESFVLSCYVRAIQELFENEGIEQRELPEGSVWSGQRRTLVEQYYHSVNWRSPTDVRRVLNVYEAHLTELIVGGSDQAVQGLISRLHIDGYAFRDGRIEDPTHAALFDSLLLHDAQLDLAQLRVIIDRLRTNADEDPALAVGSSKELVEATCKTILSHLREPIPKDADMNNLVHLVETRLGLLPAEVSDATKGATSIRRVLGGLNGVAVGLAELRNLYGSGHGRAPGHDGLSPRHARLCVGAASTLCQFLMETAVDRAAQASK